eukprot:CAMPEP_0172551610 /NCGR_PEP_ID=MMETSP1067-20121228/40102_1 /TAXON_ID=265564 ORGANISM="Thalassiosira punctigera, Strain Tpunct2005C2" /NCGR_SAMPLE_ID=MMETSP1067 /ASSEMBLY_ACC=CAM_ASM_000444 /LENGTH=67 /DNA_ID=CAMNT_0013339417 /DNA_START=38 /DNA_END=238 /DNA_ORIENTATION=-
MVFFANQRLLAATLAILPLASCFTAPSTIPAPRTASAAHSAHADGGNDGRRDFLRAVASAGAIALPP